MHHRCSQHARSTRLERNLHERNLHGPSLGPPATHQSSSVSSERAFSTISKYVASCEGRPRHDPWNCQDGLPPWGARPPWHPWPDRQSAVSWSLRDRSNTAEEVKRPQLMLLSRLLLHPSSESHACLGGLKAGNTTEFATKPIDLLLIFGLAQQIASYVESSSHKSVHHTPKLAPDEAGREGLLLR